MWLPFDCLPRIKQLVEDFTNKMAKISTNRKSYQKPPNFFYALLNFNWESPGHNFANSYFFAFKGNTGYK